MPIKNEEPNPQVEQIKSKFMGAVDDMWDANEERFIALLNASTDKVVNLTFTAKLDFSESNAQLDVGVSYGQRYKDNRSITIEDPNQPVLPFDGHRPGTGLPETNSSGDSTNGETSEPLEATPAAYKARHESNGKADKKKKASKPAKKKTAKNQ